ncbi:hypothetical protein CTA2_8631 [Colletotrichum tanaceti]|uniref:Uncharacterized protein n=1 Tax=Colletotrichum tanaceti TaxID=1306861 RepID=A0A4U6XM70_9PEZI|nr:hypothetical protein CTA2_8631 [Colletotrichum tanaceti]TKW56765.1 hypothetical protein CTA1_6856 [Colletotrichum tanaceti]
MPAAGRRAPKRRAAGRNEAGSAPPPSSIDEAPSGTRRSKRLGHVEIEEIRDFEALRLPKRQRSRKSDKEDGRHNGDEGRLVEEDRQSNDGAEEAEDAEAQDVADVADVAEDQDGTGEADDQHEVDNTEEAHDQDDGEHALNSRELQLPAAPRVSSTKCLTFRRAHTYAQQATAKPNQRQTNTSLRVDTLRKVAKNNKRKYGRRYAGISRRELVTARAAAGTPRRKSRPGQGTLGDGDAAAETEPEPAKDVYDFEATSPRREPGRAMLDAKRTARVSAMLPSETDNGLFVEQDVEDVDKGGSDEDGADEDGADEDGADEDGADEDGADEDGADEDGADEDDAGEDDAEVDDAEVDDAEEDDAEEDDAEEDDVEETDEEENGADGDGDEPLYDDPTIEGLPTSGQGEVRADAGAAHETEPPSSAATEQVRRLLVDMGPAPVERPPDEVDDTYPDDHFIFNAPEGQDRVAAAPIKSYSLKSITELMSGTGWTQSGRDITLTTGKQQLSKRTRPLWNELCQLKDFWEEMPRAPLYEQQYDYLHSDNQEASSARQSITVVDQLVREVVEKATKASTGEESDMPPSLFVTNLPERIIPLLVNTLETVFRKGADIERSRYSGKFTKTLLHIMQRVVAWTEKLYVAMQVHLARRRLKEQPLSKRTSRGKLGEYLRDFKSELEQTWTKTNEAIEREKLYEERRQLMKDRRAREKREIDEVRQRQRKLCDLRIQERTRRVTLQPRRGEAVSSQRPMPQLGSSQGTSLQGPSTQQASQGTQRHTTEAAQSRHQQQQQQQQGEAAIDGQSRPWPEEDVKKLLQMLTAGPQTQMEALVWEFERSEEDVGAMVDLLKQSARTCAAAKGRDVPAFASL